MSIRGKVRPTGTYIGLTSGASAAVSEAGEARIRYNTALNRAELSENGGAYLPFGASSGLTVTNIAGLAAVADTSLTDGSVAAMRSLMCLWQLDKTSAAAADGITVIATASGTGRWFRIEDSHEYWQTFTTWHLNEATGNDENAGNTALVPLATHEELRRRLCRRVSQSIDIYLHGSFNQDFVVDFEIPFYPTTISYHGERTIVYSSTFSGVQAYNPAIGDDGQVTDAAIPVSWTASGLVGMLLVPTSGAADGAVGWIAKDLGAKTARFSPLWDWSTYTEKTPAPGDSFDVCSLTQVSGQLKVEGSGQRYVYFYDVAFDNALLADCVVRTCSAVGGETICTTCSFDGNGFKIGPDTFDMVGCRLGPFVNNAFIEGMLWIEGCLIENRLSTGQAGQIYVFESSIIQYVSAQVGIKGNLFAYDSLGCFDAVNANWRVVEVGFDDLAERCQLFALVWGSGNTMDYMFEVHPFCGIQYAVVPTVGTATVNDVLVGATADVYAALPIVDSNKLCGMVS